MPKVIGLTGGIGSGKTTVAKYFQTFGIPVYIADDEAKKISESPEICSKIKNIFGDSVFDNNILNRKKLADIVFDNKAKLAQLNAVIHPAVKIHFENWVKLHNENDFVIKETAILFESGSYKFCDYIITVVAPLETRIKRIIKRDNSSRAEILTKMSNQWSDEERIDKSDFVIFNISNAKTLKQIKKLIDLLRIQ